MEIAVNLPISSWYQPSPDNDLSYWGLDYPPLSGYFAALLGSMYARCSLPLLIPILLA